MLSQSLIDSSHEESNKELGLVVCSKLILLIKLPSFIRFPLYQSTAVWVNPLSDLCNELTTKSAFDDKAGFGKLSFSQKRKYEPWASSTKTGKFFWWQQSIKGSKSLAYPW